MRHISTWLLLAGALTIGGAIAWVDSRPTWDDTGITAATILIVCAGFGIARPRLVWLWALAVGGWVPVLGVLLAGNYGTLLALAIALAGAYAGALLGRALWHTSAPR